jgi:hypothetical protein
VVVAKAHKVMAKMEEQILVVVLVQVVIMDIMASAAPEVQV